VLLNQHFYVESRGTDVTVLKTTLIHMYRGAYAASLCREVCIPYYSVLGDNFMGALFKCII